jgi:hypothetical protein
LSFLLVLSVAAKRKLRRFVTGLWRASLPQPCQARSPQNSGFRFTAPRDRSSSDAEAIAAILRMAAVRLAAERRKNAATQSPGTVAAIAETTEGALNLRVEAILRGMRRARARREAAEERGC